MDNHLSLKNITALVVGNAFEWYDYFIYSFFSLYLGKLFFPSTMESHSLFAISATFGAAFFMRPLGGVVLGLIADKYGRIFAMNCSIGLMVLALVLITVIPTYSDIGLVASFLFIIARLSQGFSAGGEGSITAVLLLESAPSQHRGFYCSLQTFSKMVAVILSLLVSILLTSLLSAAQIESWGWRIPFFIGLLLAPIGIYLRKHLSDVNFSPREKNPVPSLMTIVRNNIKHLLIVVGIVSGGGTAGMYVLLTSMPIYVAYVHLSVMDAYISVLIGVGLTTFLIPLFGKLADKVGCKPLLILAMVSALLEFYPCFYWLNAAPSLNRLIIIQCILGLSFSIYYGAITPAITVFFPKQVRTTCLAIGFNSSVLLFGAFAQFIVTVSVKWFNTPLAVTFYPLVAVLLSLVSILLYQEDKIRINHSSRSTRFIKFPTAS